MRTAAFALLVAACAPKAGPTSSSVTEACRAVILEEPATIYARPSTSAPVETRLAVGKGFRPVELLRFYVESKWHGLGVGQALMERCLALAREEGYQTLWLGVWEHNERALAFYKKYCFVAVGQHRFQLGHDEQVDLILVRTVCRSLQT